MPDLIPYLTSSAFSVTKNIIYKICWLIFNLVAVSMWTCTWADFYREFTKAVAKLL